MAAVEERELVASGKVVVEADQQELLDLGVAIRFRRDIRVCARAVGTERIGHIRW